MLAMSPAQQGQQCHFWQWQRCLRITMAMMPSWQGQWHQLNNRNNAIAMRATTLLYPWQRHLDCKDANALMTTTPLKQGQQCQLDNGEDACTLMMAMTPLLRG
jgi:hypothetical protein